MKKFTVQIILFALIISCVGKPIKPKPKSMLNLKYPLPTYIVRKSKCQYSLKINRYSNFISSDECRDKITYPNLKGTIYLTYKRINNNFDSLLSDAYSMPLKHVRKAVGIPEKVFINRRNKTYGSIFKIVGNAASQVQFFLTDSLNHFIFGALYFYKRPNYDSIMPAVNYIGDDISKLMESIKWTN
tara:strand:- start:285 stop:842 length:558 start_codon:yes stop_codon:yes gene_type:complete